MPSERAMTSLLRIVTARLIWAAVVVWLLAETTEIFPEMLRYFKGG